MPNTLVPIALSGNLKSGFMSLALIFKVILAITGFLILYEFQNQPVTFCSPWDCDKDFSNSAPEIFKEYNMIQHCFKSRNMAILYELE